MKFRQIAATILLSSATAFASIFVYNKYLQDKPGMFQNGSDDIPVNYAKYTSMPGTAGANAAPTDFQQAAKVASPGVVHIKTKINPRKVSNNLERRKSPLQDLFGGEDDFWDEFLGNRGGRQYYIPGQMASGSGVLISDDGYIVTNNHVVDGADEVSVTLANNKTFPAKIVGIDPNTDLAVIKIEATNLPYLLYGNSDEVNVGQWVLAIGYPLNLDATVTAGIVSAKARSIGINRQNSRRAIESFIQTDAAVNQGNSGGALINTAGELIGINAAIASPTGAYAGYSYAIPVNLVKKVVNDLLKYGNVQRAYLGINYSDPSVMTERERQELGVSPDFNGVAVAAVPEIGAAYKAGIKRGDIITGINGVPTPTAAEMMEQVARYKPGDKITISYLRDNKAYTVSTTLKNAAGTTDIVKADVLDYLGADLEPIRSEAAREVGIDGGVQVIGITTGILKKQTTMKPGFVILKAGDTKVTSLESLKKALEKNPSTQLVGFYPRMGGGLVYYNIKMTEDF
ncbi:trypsin-like peptidase domain-containing protein [Chitinophaga horti]|uniref:Trypsin-like peptidase domain-containing protein n=1 Tax=Chitinophaga horti TaxID=2920382 RepID=A0ABY6IUS8_9BACT|nr:trypsin-like peptidase domain-containing protein [Chitinophaga horti]UYQ91110.1 trypsin-like peptidase domain-containing protein [Chitinophaga horti]